LYWALDLDSITIRLLSLW